MRPFRLRSIVAPLAAILAAASAAPAQQVVRAPEVAPADAEGAALAAELEQIRMRDQGVRERFTQLIKDGVPVPETFHEEWRRTDDENLAALKAFVQEHGWPVQSKVGSNAAMAAFLVIQHADPATQRDYMPKLKKAAEVGELQKGLVAYLEDRVRVGLGQKQLYGTQITVDQTGKAVPEPLEDPEHVDERRAEVGMPPLDVYVKMVGSRSLPPPSAGVDAGAIDQDLRGELNALHTEYRKIAPATFEGGVTHDEKTWPAEIQAKRREVREKFSARLAQILDDKGYPGTWLAGEDGNRAFLALLPETTPSTEEKALAKLEGAVKAGRNAKAQFAWLTDRVRRAQGKPQIYGTHVERDAGGKVVASPMEDPASVNERRAAVGLRPLEEYLGLLNPASAGGSST
jgi:hypothetical protein